MAVRANLLVDVVSALKLSVVERSERPGEAPFLRVELRFVAHRLGRRLCVLRKRSAERTGESNDKARNERKAEWRRLGHATGSGARRWGAGFAVARGGCAGPQTHPGTAH